MSERIYIGDEEPGDVLRALFAIVEELGEDPRAVVWIGEELAVDVPESVAAKYIAPEKPKRARKAAKALPPPPPATEKE